MDPPFCHSAHSEESSHYLFLCSLSVQRSFDSRWSLRMTPLRGVADEQCSPLRRHHRKCHLPSLGEGFCGRFVNRPYSFILCVSVGSSKHGTGQIPFAGVRQDHHQGLACVFRTLCHFHCGVQGSSGRNAHQQAFPAAHFCAHGVGLFLCDGDDLVQKGGIQNRRHKACADTLQAVTAGSAPGKYRKAS